MTSCCWTISMLINSSLWISFQHITVIISYFQLQFHSDSCIIQTCSYWTPWTLHIRHHPHIVTHFIPSILQYMGILGHGSTWDNDKNIEVGYCVTTANSQHTWKNGETFCCGNAYLNVGFWWIMVATAIRSLDLLVLNLYFRRRGYLRAGCSNFSSSWYDTIR